MQRTVHDPLRDTLPECHLGVAILRRGWAGAAAAVKAMAGLERNRFRTSDAFREAARSALERHTEIATLEQLAKVLGMSSRTLARRLREFGIPKDELADWRARSLQARSATTTPTPTRWVFCLLITAVTLEEAIARFRDEINPSVEIESVQKIAGMSAGMTPA